MLTIAAALTWLGLTARSDVQTSGLTTCSRRGVDCSAALAHLQHDYHWLPPVAAGLFVLPLLAGMFWGAPLVAREIETGTYRLVWTQSVSRLRWICTKIGLIFSAATAATLAISLLAVWAFQPLIPVLGNRFRGGWFDVQGIVPAAYMLMAMALGSCLGAAWRRTIPAMATTIVGYAAVRIPIHILRRDLVSPTTKTFSSFIGDTPAGLGPGDWIVGRAPTGVPTSGRPTNGPPAAIVRYIPSSSFWTLQGIETAIFLTLAAALIAVCIVIVIRARPH